jgi:hypothetical protein
MKQMESWQIILVVKLQELEQAATDCRERNATPFLIAANKKITGSDVMDWDPLSA